MSWRATAGGILSLATLAVTGCALDGGENQTLSVAQARAAVTAGFGVPVFPQRRVVTEATVANLDAVYYGGTDYADVLVAVFDDDRGKRDLLGSERASPPPGTEIISVANVTVVYSRSEDAPDRSSLIRGALERARTNSGSTAGWSPGSRARRPARRLAASPGSSTSERPTALLLDNKGPIGAGQ